MKARREVQLVIDTKENVLVKSHQGKIKSDGTVKPLKGQEGVTCTIASRERLRIFYGKEAEKSEDLKEINGRKNELILKKIKKIMATQPLDYSALLEECTRGLEHLSFDPITEIFKHPDFIRKKTEYFQSGKSTTSIKFYNMADDCLRGKWAFFALMDKLDQQFGFENLDWTIQDRFEGLQQALRENGQIIFQGKYGMCFHGRANVQFHSQESTTSRQVYFFKKGTLHASTWTHCVIVDQVKLIDGRPFVFFRDPYNESIPGEPDKAYMLSYESFIQRISDKYGNVGGPETTYGLVIEQAKAVGLDVDEENASNHEIGTVTSTPDFV